MRKIAYLIFVLMFAFSSVSCTKSIIAVGSLDELTTKEDLEKPRNWYKQSEARGQAAFIMGFTEILLPVAVLVAFTPNYSELTVAQIAEFSAAATYDYNATFHREWVAYTDKPIGANYWIYGRAKGMKDDQGLKPVGLVYANKDTYKAYYEVWVLQKDNVTGRYLAWKTPVFKKKGDNLVYALNENLVLKKASVIMKFTFENSLDGTEVVKDEKDVLIDFRALYVNGGTLSELKYCDADREKKKTETRQVLTSNSAYRLPRSGIDDMIVK